MDEMIMLDDILPIEIALQREMERRRKVGKPLSLRDCDDHENGKSVMDDEEFIVLDNLMPVKIALEREIEYRRKIEAFEGKPEYLQILHHPNDQAPCLPTEEALFVPIVPTKKRKAPETASGIMKLGKNLQSYEKKADFLSCSACKVSFSTVYNLKHHTGSSSHKDKLQLLKANGYHMSNPLTCELCNAKCSSEIPLESHLIGTKHLSALEKLQAMRLASG
ncbi:uncharacterized protein LOC124921633 isoform X2 [Impatiens glandulifera]|uniref:uncharacterized protein LOC124921633 isoform X2 n=1 Tax=Impatiens glandulifera TaxID=253017 RepID=UPI001FB076BE|nr:uncharacterized protein LOC124921633 isoform X2 [Impatiens glandulifera]